MPKLRPQDAPPLVIDTREQLPYEFDHPTVVETLKTGDYSVVGLEDEVAVERKELGDFIGCCTQSRERFEKELDRALGLRRLWVVVEGTIRQIAEGMYRSQAHPSSLIGTIAAWENRYDPVRFMFAGDRQIGQALTLRLLTRAWADEANRNAGADSGGEAAPDG